MTQPTQPLTDPERIAAGLTEAQREDWIRTVLTVLSSEPQRRSFVAGYNGERRPPSPATEAKWQAFYLGQRVHVHLAENRHEG